MTTEPKYILMAPETIRRMTPMFTSVFHEAATDYGITKSILRATRDGEVNTFTMGRMLRATFDDTIHALPQFWSDETRLERALTGAYDFERSATLKKFRDGLMLVDIILHNDQMQNQEVRRTFAKDYADSIITEEQVADALVNTALFREVETGTGTPLVWECLRTYCTIRQYTLGEPISDYTRTKIASVAHKEGSPNAEMACDLLRALQSGALQSAPAPHPAAG